MQTSFYKRTELLGPLDFESPLRRLRSSALESTSWPDETGRAPGKTETQISRSCTPRDRFEFEGCHVRSTIFRSSRSDKAPGVLGNDLHLIAR
jgi:hypothetical protein